MPFCLHETHEAQSQLPCFLCRQGKVCSINTAWQECGLALRMLQKMQYEEDPGVRTGTSRAHNLTNRNKWLMTGRWPIWSPKCPRRKRLVLLSKQSPRTVRMVSSRYCLRHYQALWITVSQPEWWFCSSSTHFHWVTRKGFTQCHSDSG